MQRDTWLEAMKAWRGLDKQAIEQLADLVNQLPVDAFDDFEYDSARESLAYWLEANLALMRQYQAYGQVERGFSYLQLAYSKLQGLLCQTDLDLDMRRWIIKKLDMLIVAVMEYCQRQPDQHWQKQSEQLLDLHVSFMKQHHPVTLKMDTHQAPKWMC
ncbi:hypothetical protein VST7929_03208 [Vibrio stylophorae]|uniref:Transcriptional regulator n=1 Tax=Vibrio stylophorae TaxID=659351 RepID=A0ABN8E264_9VIBR|nr:hypothetical protein [Vibrio stylophorae]CAH0535734.1 hypothetical protein VST7929_03208 [Vibrio stylophorae]